MSASQDPPGADAARAPGSPHQLALRWAGSVLAGGVPVDETHEDLLLAFAQLWLELLNQERPLPGDRDAIVAELLDIQNLPDKTSPFAGAKRPFYLWLRESWQTILEPVSGGPIDANLETHVLGVNLEGVVITRAGDAKGPGVLITVSVTPAGLRVRGLGTALTQPGWPPTVVDLVDNQLRPVAPTETELARGHPPRWKLRDEGKA
jgi:hypothetical protein